MRLLVLAAYVSMTALAAAQSKTLTIDFTQGLTGPDGKPLTSQQCKTFTADGKTCQTFKPLTLGDVAAVALDSTLDGDRTMAPEVKFAHDKLARKIYDNKAATLSVDDIATIKQRIGQVYGPVQVGASWPLLDPSVETAKP